MPEFLAERYEPGLTMAAVEAAVGALGAAAVSLASAGGDVCFLGTTFVPGDEAAFSQFSGTSAAVVAAVHHLAEIPYERIVEVRSVRTPARPTRST